MSPVNPMGSVSPMNPLTVGVSSALDAHAPTNPMLPRIYRVRRTRRELADTVTLDLTPADGAEVPPFTAGQFNMLYVPGIGEIPISFSGAPAAPGASGAPAALTHTVRAVGAVSRAVCRLKRGDMVGVRGPFGRGWPVERGLRGDIVLVAGGIGMAPLRSALYAALARRAEFGRVIVLYGARTPLDILYEREVERWHAHSGVDVAITVDHATASWRGSVGVVTRLIPRSPFDPQHTVALVCGPEIMMRFSAAELVKRGVTQERIFVSLERNMKCAIGFCGHCQYGPYFLCRDGPVFPYSDVQEMLTRAEI